MDILNDHGVTANGAGTIELIALGVADGDDINIDENITSGTGAITITSKEDVAIGGA